MATLAPTPADKKVLPGGSFLISNPTPADCFFPEDFTEEHRQIAQTTTEFALNEVVPLSDQIEAKDFAVTRRLIKQASDLGLTSVDIPEEYGGLEMDKVTSAIIADNIAKQGSFSVAFSAHVGIGTLPIVWYGTPEQKKKYLPKLASGEFIGAYALSESTSGSDALNARTRAVLSEDGADLHPQRREDVDLERWLRRSLHRLCQVRGEGGQGRREGAPHRLPHRAWHPGIYRWEGGAQAWHPRQLHLFR